MSIADILSLGMPILIILAFRQERRLTRLEERFNFLCQYFPLGKHWNTDQPADNDCPAGDEEIKNGGI